MPYLTLNVEADDKSCLNCMHTKPRKQTAGQKKSFKRNFQICLIFFFVIVVSLFQTLRHFIHISAFFISLYPELFLFLF